MSTHDPETAIGSDASPPDPARPARGGLYLRAGATAVLVGWSILSAARFASASFDDVSLPIGDVTTPDGIISGTVRITGGRFAFYSGDRFESTTQNLAVNFTSGGSLVLCPHSQVQILAANHSSGMMLAFQEGGSEQPFPVHTNDVVMTPDWRIEMLGNVHGGDTGVLQVSTSRRGDLCLAGNVQSGAYFRVSQLVGDATFDIAGQSSVRLSGGRMENSAGGCSCQNGSPAGPAEVASSAPVATTPPATVTLNPAPAIPTPSAAPAMPAGSNSYMTAPYVTAQLNAAPAADSEPRQKNKQRPQDVVGYMRSFIHLMFGR